MTRSRWSRWATSTRTWCRRSPAKKTIFLCVKSDPGNYGLLLTTYTMQVYPADSIDPDEGSLDDDNTGSDDTLDPVDAAAPAHQHGLPQPMDFPVHPVEVTDQVGVDGTVGVDSNTGSANTLDLADDDAAPAHQHGKPLDFIVITLLMSFLTMAIVAMLGYVDRQEPKTVNEGGTQSEKHLPLSRTPAAPRLRAAGNEPPPPSAPRRRAAIAVAVLAFAPLFGMPTAMAAVAYDQFGAPGLALLTEALPPQNANSTGTFGAAEEVERENAALRGMVAERDREIAALRARTSAGQGRHDRAAPAAGRRRLSTLGAPTLGRQAPPRGPAPIGNDMFSTDLMGQLKLAREFVLDKLDEGHPGQDFRQPEARRHLQQGAWCGNVAELLSWGPAFGGIGGPHLLGTHACGHVVATSPQWGSIDHVCHSYLCDSDANGTNLCVMAGMCDAMCGFCASDPEGELTLGQNFSVDITAADSTNTPRYHTLSAIAGQIYRVRAFPDLEADPVVRSMLLVVRNPDGNPIRRAVSNTGTPIRDTAEFVHRTAAELEAEPHDTEMGCSDDNHLDILFKAVQDGVYTIGLSQATDSMLTRTADISVYNFSKQWRGVIPLDGVTMLDLGQTGGFVRRGGRRHAHAARGRRHD